MMMMMMESNDATLNEDLEMRILILCKIILPKKKREWEKSDDSAKIEGRDVYNVPNLDLSSLFSEYKLYRI